MQAVVDRVMRAFTLKHPISDEEAEAVRKEVTAYAATGKIQGPACPPNAERIGTPNLGHTLGPGLTHHRQHARCDQQRQQQ